jgi:cysteinyl-tRNA synthetase
VHKNIEPLAYRYFVLQGRYGTTLNFTWEAVLAAQTALAKLRKQIEMLGTDSGTIDIAYREKFENFMFDDLDTPKALALIWELLKDDAVSAKDKRATILFFDTTLALNLGFSDTTTQEQAFETLPGDVQALIAEREEARHKKDWKKSDEIRQTIFEKGYELKDTPDGAKVFLI